MIKYIVWKAGELQFSKLCNAQRVPAIRSNLADSFRVQWGGLQILECRMWVTATLRVQWTALDNRHAQLAHHCSRMMHWLQSSSGVWETRVWTSLPSEKLLNMFRYRGFHSVESTRLPHQPQEARVRSVQFGASVARTGVPKYSETELKICSAKFIYKKFEKKSWKKLERVRKSKLKDVEKLKKRK